MTAIKSLLVALMIFAGIETPVRADLPQDSSLWQCSLNFSAHGGGLQVLVGYFTLRGYGTLQCTNTQGATDVIPVRVSLGGRPVALRVAAGSYRMSGVAGGIAISGSPEQLLGRYYTVGAQAAFVGGAGAQVAFRSKHGASTLNVSLQLIEGIGLNVGVTSLRLKRANPYAIY